MEIKPTTNTATNQVCSDYNELYIESKFHLSISVVIWQKRAMYGALRHIESKETIVEF